MSLWEYDKTLQLNDSDLKRESAFAAAMVQQALFGDIPEPKDYRHAVSLGRSGRSGLIPWLRSGELLKIVERGCSYPEIRSAPTSQLSASMSTVKNCFETVQFSTSQD
jgi:hypothetical protein